MVEYSIRSQSHRRQSPAGEPFREYFPDEALERLFNARQLQKNHNIIQRINCRTYTLTIWYFEAKVDRSLPSMAALIKSGKMSGVQPKAGIPIFTNS